MAIYHLNIRIHSRAKGHSAVAASAYRAGVTLHDERADKTHNYEAKRDVVHAEIVAPQNAPDWVFDRSALWNTVEQQERQKNGQLAREVECALPRELSLATCTRMVRHFVQERFVSRGMIADFAIHNPPASDGLTNPHVHILLTMKGLDGDNLAKAKNRQWNADFANISGGKGYIKNSETIKALRKQWADIVNQYLSDSDMPERIDHRSYKEMGIQQEPTKHLGRHAEGRRGYKQQEFKEHNYAVDNRNDKRRVFNHPSTKRKQSLGDRLSAIQEFEEMQRDLYGEHDKGFYGKEDRDIDR